MCLCACLHVCLCVCVCVRPTICRPVCTGGTEVRFLGKDCILGTWHLCTWLGLGSVADRQPARFSSKCLLGPHFLPCKMGVKSLLPRGVRGPFGPVHH